MTRLTRQGIPDLNPRPVNGHRRVPCRPHLPGPMRVVGQRYVSWDDILHGYYVDIYGRHCLKCGEVCG